MYPGSLCGRYTARRSRSYGFCDESGEGSSGVLRWHWRVRRPDSRNQRGCRASIDPSWALRGHWHQASQGSHIVRGAWNRENSTCQGQSVLWPSASSNSFIVLSGFDSPWYPCLSKLCLPFSNFQLKLHLQAVANSTSATFLRVVGSELIQKYLGDGPKLVRELFRVADELSPSIVFIDEIDAVGTKRYDAHSGGEREIQRTMLELLNQLDGFDSRGDVKVILATNRIESLDPALLRPGRIDRKIEFPLPDIKTRRRIFQVLFHLWMI